eukprot:11077357-Heterocapsa_arctica.AAC.1
MKHNINNLGNILEAIVGYAWLSQYMKEYDLKEFVEIANYEENGLMQRMTAEDEEDQEEVEEKGGGSSEGSK